MQTLAEYPAAADLLLRRYLLLERQAGCAAQLTSGLQGMADYLRELNSEQEVIGGYPGQFRRCS